MEKTPTDLAPVGVEDVGSDMEIEDSSVAPPVASPVLPVDPIVTEAKESVDGAHEMKPLLRKDDNKEINHDDIDLAVIKLIREQKAQAAMDYRKFLLAGDHDKADMAFTLLRKFGAQLLDAMRKAPTGNPVPYAAVVKREVGLRFTQKDIPKFQLTSWTDLPFPGERCYDTVEHFLRSFEKVIYSAALDIQEVWHRYLPVALAFDHDDWVEKDLKKCRSWSEARLAFVDKFLTEGEREDAVHLLFTMTMNKTESIAAYMTRFINKCTEAGVSKNDAMVANRFKASLTPEIVDKCKPVFLLKKDESKSWTVERVADIARGLMGDDPRKYYKTIVDNNYSNYNKRSLGGAGPATSKRNKSHGSSGFFCSMHGGPKSNHNEEDCFHKRKDNKPIAATSHTTGPKNNFYGNKNVIHRAPTLCKYCGKNWTVGHKCKEYMELKKTLRVDHKNPKDSDKSIYAVIKASNADSDHEMTELENHSYDCKAI
ncbi:hypothetical protein RMCBS344292_19498 [Rhizopus microsporus]|nr:hypothetical protein RMCBS344292_19498 [Rhizopus microsporus]